MVTMRTTYYVDADGDGFGDASLSVSRCAADATHTVTQGTDCDDANPTSGPTSPEVCDAEDADEDCDGLSDDADPSATGKTPFYADVDNDGYGDAASTRMRCDASATYDVENATDCNDMRGTVNPEEDERENGLDDDCDGTVDEGRGGGDAGVEPDGGTGDTSGGGGCSAHPGSTPGSWLALVAATLGLARRRRRR